MRTGQGAASLTWIHEQQAAAKGRIRKLLAGIASCCLEWRVPGDLACGEEANSGDEDSQEGGTFCGVLVRGVSTPPHCRLRLHCPSLQFPSIPLLQSNPGTSRISCSSTKFYPSDRLQYYSCVCLTVGSSHGGSHSVDDRRDESDDDDDTYNESDDGDDYEDDASIEGNDEANPYLEDDVDGERPIEGDADDERAVEGYS